MPCTVQVNKPVPLIEEFERLSNTCLASSFNASDRTVNFAALQPLSIQTVGLFGRNEDVLEALQAKGAAHSLSGMLPPDGLCKVNLQVKPAGHIVTYLQ